tara:strand:+ start:600 stop:1118 length:519 start_codon:yes stop_codon:yes gene_type:complete
MGYAEPASQNNNTELRMLHGVHMLCMSAQQFFQQAAYQVDDSNLRYKFLELSKLHANAARKLPVATSAPSPHIQDSELAAVQFWYLHQQASLNKKRPQPLMLTELADLLQQQLYALKHLTKHVGSNSGRVPLAHLSAALQMAYDQLLPLLKVLPTGGQKLQQKFYQHYKIIN